MPMPVPQVSAAQLADLQREHSAQGSPDDEAAMQAAYMQKEASAAGENSPAADPTGEADGDARQQQLQAGLLGAIQARRASCTPGDAPVANTATADDDDDDW